MKVNFENQVIKFFGGNKKIKVGVVSILSWSADNTDEEDDDLSNVNV